MPYSFCIFVPQLFPFKFQHVHFSNMFPMFFSYSFPMVYHIIFPFNGHILRRLPPMSSNGLAGDTLALSVRLRARGTGTGEPGGAGIHERISMAENHPEVVDIYNNLSTSEKYVCWYIHNTYIMYIYIYVLYRCVCVCVCVCFYSKLWYDWYVSRWMFLSK